MKEIRNTVELAYILKHKRPRFLARVFVWTTKAAEKAVNLFGYTFFPLMMEEDSAGHLHCDVKARRKENTNAPL